MSDVHGKHVLVFHVGALGDFVLTWPLLRALLSAGAAVTVVARDSHARFARRILGVDAVSQERPEVTRLWSDSPRATVDRDRWKHTLGDRTPDVIVTFAADPATGQGSRWHDRARAELGTDHLLYAGPPGSESRADVWTWARVGHLGSVPVRPRAGTTPVIHIGAGGRFKMWPMDRWRDLIRETPFLHHAIVIGGEVEAERLSGPERSTFEALGGRVLTSLDDLVDLLIDPATSAGLPGFFIGADTGPTHLAAQLGIPTLALFGPTDPTIWSPVGPIVRVVRASEPLMHALTVEQVQLGLDELLLQAAGGRWGTTPKPPSS